MGAVVTFAGYRILIFLVQLLNKPCHCLVASMVSDEKFARNFTKVLLSSCFQDSLYVLASDSWIIMRAAVVLFILLELL